MPATSRNAPQRHARTNQDQHKLSGIGERRDTWQPTISRYTAVVVPLVKSVLEEFVPDAEEAIEMVRGRVVLVDGTLTPCWAYEEHRELWNKKHKTTGFNAQLKPVVLCFLFHSSRCSS